MRALSIFLGVSTLAVIIVSIKGKKRFKSIPAKLEQLKRLTLHQLVGTFILSFVKGGTRQVSINDKDVSDKWGAPIFHRLVYSLELNFGSGRRY